MYYNGTQISVCNKNSNIRTKQFEKNVELRAKKETQRLIDSMIKDSNLTKHQANTIKTIVNKKCSLPVNGIAVSREQELNDQLYAYRRNDTGSNNMFGQKSYFMRKKKLETMVTEGAFEVERYKPKDTIKMDRDLEKDYLNTYFEFGGKESTPEAIIDARFNKNKTHPERLFILKKVEEDDFYIDEGE
jgi:hypothetical protein